MRSRLVARSSHQTGGRLAVAAGDAHDEQSPAEGTWLVRSNASGEGLRRTVAPMSSAGAGVGVAPILRRSTASVGVRSDSATIRRTISKTSADIKAKRTERGVKKGARTKDTLHGLGKLLDKHHKLVDLEKQGKVSQDKVMASLEAIVHLCDEYLLVHSRSRQQDRTILVDDIRAEAYRDHGTVLAQNRYLNDLKAGTTPRKRDPLTVKPTATPMTQHLNDNVSYNAHMSHKNRGEVAQGQQNPVNAVRAAIREAGLTEAEIAAIKTFTASDYLYLNPAVGNDRKWLRKQMKAIQGGMDLAHAGRQVDADALVQEGSTHAGVMMQGLAKLPPMKGKVYRGARMSPKEFKKAYGTKSIITNQTFVSSSTNPAPARNYASGGGSKPARPSQTISAYAVFDCVDARDVKFISEVQTEDEWLLLPGATFAITKIEDDPDFDSSRGATSGKIVHLKQIPKPPKDDPAPPDRKFPIE